MNVFWYGCDLTDLTKDVPIEMQTPEESVGGLMVVIEALNEERTGKFYNQKNIPMGEAHTVQVIIGGNRGIGLELVKQSRERGYTVCVCRRE